MLNDVASPIGGAEVQTHRLRDALRARGHEVRLFASSAFANGTDEADYLCFGTGSGVRTAVRTVNPSAFVRLRGGLRAFEPDVVHVRMFTRLCVRPATSCSPTGPSAPIRPASPAAATAVCRDVPGRR